jgi:hypothetical protein
MRLNVLLSLLVIALLIVGCFLPWITVESKSMTITGVDTAGTRFGKPAYFHFLWAGLCLFFFADKYGLVKTGDRPICSVQYRLGRTKLFTYSCLRRWRMSNPKGWSLPCIGLLAALVFYAADREAPTG